MKSYSHLMEQFASEENYYLGVKNACKHKNGNKPKYYKMQFYKLNAERLKPKMLYYATHFHNEDHTPKQINDGIMKKKRTIVVPAPKEQIIHHMIINVLGPIFLKGMYEHSYGSIPGRGSHSKNKGVRGGKEQIEKWIRRNDKHMKYCLKMDINKYFDSIPHDILKKKFAKLIHDQEFLAVINEIVDVIPGDKGIPIGFYTSQWIANWYLTELDHYIKEQLKVKYYIRYMDDMVIFGSNKRELHRVREAIQNYLEDRLGLTLKSNWQVFLFDYIKKNGQHIGRDLDFMGFRFFRDRTILRKSIMYKLCRKARKIGKKSRYKLTLIDCRQMLSYLGWIDCTSTYEIYKQRIKPNVSFKSMKHYVSKCQQESNKPKIKNNKKKRKGSG